MTMTQNEKGRDSGKSATPMTRSDVNTDCGHPVRVSGAMTATPFSFEGAAVRVVTVDGEPWFVAHDVACVLGYRMASDMTRFLDDDEKGTQIVRTPSGDQVMLAINEPGLYAAILKSRKPEARSFKRWITAEVLPTIRKTGSYSMSRDAVNEPRFSVPQTFADALRLAAAQQDQIESQQVLIEAQRPAVAALKLLSESAGSKCVSDAAKDLNMRPSDLFEWMRKNRWAFRRGEHGKWTARQEAINAGVMESRVSWYLDENGFARSSSQPLVTAHGLTVLAKKLAVAA